MVLEPQIVVGVDGSASSRAALEWAARRAERQNRSLLLVHSVPDYLVSPARIEYHSVRNALRGLLDSEVSRAREFAPSLEVRGSLRFGEPAQVLAESSDGSAMVVVGTDRTADVHGEGFGAVNLQLATMARSPVAVIPARQSPAAVGVVVGIDGSPQSMAAAHFAAAEAATTEQELTLIFVSSPAAPWLAASSLGPVIAKENDARGRIFLESTAATLRTSHIHLAVSERYEHDDRPARVLVNAAKQAAMLVMGSRGQGGTHHVLIGSTTQNLLLHLPCPVVLTQLDYGSGSVGQPDGSSTPTQLPLPAVGTSRGF